MAKAKKQVVTVTEIKAMLVGIDMIKGGNSWCPDPAQWARIREKLDMLEEVTTPATSQPATSQPVYRSPAPNNIPQMGPQTQTAAPEPMRLRPPNPSQLSSAFSGSAPGGVQGPVLPTIGATEFI